MKDKKQTEIKKQKGKGTKEKNDNKFLEVIKKKWLIDGSKTFLLIAIILFIAVAINIGMQKWDLTPIDLSQDKLYTLTQESKGKVENITKEVHIYFVGFSEDDTTLDLARQYNKVNDKIIAEAVDANNRPDLVGKYGIESGNQGIIVECGTMYKVLTSTDLVTYDTTTYETINIAEQKLTAAIQAVTTDEIPKVYFLTGYSSFSLQSGMQYLNMYLQNEINEVVTVDLLTTGKVPDDCDTLVITTPEKDFDEVTTNAIIEYIHSGRDILWMNAAIAVENNYPNVNKILALYGINPFGAGIIRETDTSKMVSGAPDLIMPEIKQHAITKDLYNAQGVIFINATKINIMETEKLEELKVEKTELITASEKSYFRTDYKINSDTPIEGEEKGPFLMGAELRKTIQSKNEENGEKETISKLVIYGENYFVSDAQLTSNSQTPVVQYRQNKDLVLNAIAYLADRQEDITVRKSTGSVTYTATQQQNNIILMTIFGIPVLIVITGIIVWIRRKRRK